MSAASSITEESIASKSSKSSISEDIKTEIHTEKKYVVINFHQLHVLLGYLGTDSLDRSALLGGGGERVTLK